MDSALSKIFKVSEQIDNGRTMSDVMLILTEEVGELATEIAIKKGFKNRAPSNDGVLGEAVDVILAAADIIFLYANRGLSNEELEAVVNKRIEKKLEKWVGLQNEN